MALLHGKLRLWDTTWGAVSLLLEAAPCSQWVNQVLVRVRLLEYPPAKDTWLPSIARSFRRLNSPGKVQRDMYPLSVRHIYFCISQI